LPWIEFKKIQFRKGEIQFTLSPRERAGVRGKRAMFRPKIYSVSHSNMATQYHFAD
jgi:hypothetical protein